MNTTRRGTVSGRILSGVVAAILAAIVVAAFGAVGVLHAQDGVGRQTGIDVRIPYSVSIDGDRAVVGAPWHGGYKGAAYVLHRDGSRWTLEERLSPDDLGELDHFGASVSMRGDRVVVGAPWRDVLRGAAYVFVREGDRWAERQELVAGDAQPESYFGSAVKIAETDLKVCTRASARGGEAAEYRFGLAQNEWKELGRSAVPAPEAGPRVIGGRAVASAPGVETTQDDALALIGLVEHDGGEGPPVAAPLALTPPSWVLATDGTLEKTVDVTWENTGQKAIAYKVIRDDTLLSLVSRYGSSYNDSTASFGHTYSYCVVVTDMVSEETVPVCDNGSRIVFAPHDVFASDGEYVDAVRITWIDMSSINDGYAIYRQGVPIDSVAANAIYYLDETAAAHPDSVYTYGVAAYVTSGAQSAIIEDTGWRGVMQPPADLVATQGQYLDRVVLTWTCQATNELGYHIYRDSVLIDSTGADVLTYTDSPVGPNQSHEYCVATKGAGGAESIHVCATGGTMLPAPANVSASDSIYDDKVRITWEDRAARESGYEISRVETGEPLPPEEPTGHGKGALRPYKPADGGTVVLGTTRANATVWDDRTAEPGVVYVYSVRAVSDLGGASAAVSDTGSRSVVLAPYDVTATSGTFEDRVEISWKTNSTRTALFKIMRAGVMIETMSAGDRTCRDYEGTAGQEYVYTVTAVTELGAEAAGPSVTGKRQLLAPSGLTASDETFEDKTVIAWTDNSRIEQGYRVLRQDTASGVIDTLPALGPNRTSYTDYTGVPGATYRYRVAAFDSINGTLGYSAVAEDLGRRVLLAPTNVAADKGASESSVEITWRDDSDAEDGYRIYRDAVLVGTVGDNSISFVDPSPAFGSKHRYDVRAYDAYGESEAASDSGYTTLLAPMSFNASDVYEDRVEMTWVDRSGIEEGFKIYRDGELLENLAPNVTSYTYSKFGLAGFYDTPGQSYDVVVSGNYAYVADGSAGLQIIDISNPAAPTLVGTYHSLGTSTVTGALDEPVTTWFVAVAGNYAYVPDQYSNLRIINISNPASPTLAGTYGPMSYPKGIDVVGNYAYVADGPGGLKILNISNPASPTLVGTYDPSNDEDDVVVVGNYAYVAGHEAGLQIVNVSNPASPTLAGSLDTPGYAQRLAVAGSYAYIADESYGVQVIDISNPASPTLVGNYNTSSTAMDVAVAGHYVYVAESISGLEIVNVSNPASPTLVGASDTPGTALGVAVAGSYAYVADETSGLQIIAIFLADPGVTYQYCVRAYKDEILSGSSCDNGVIEAPTAHAEMTELFQKLLAADGAQDDHFGCSVSISGDHAIVGAYYDDDKGANSGSVYMFELVSGTWTQKAKLTASDGAAGDEFGYSVCISGDRAIVGAHYDDDRGANSGSVYMFELVSGTWTQKTKLTASDGAAGDEFGKSVSMSGDRAVVGSKYDADKGTNSGSAYIYELVSSTWTFKQKLTASDGAAYDYFGSAVAINGDLAIIGAPGDSDHGSQSGSAYVFVRGASTWTQAQKLTASDGAASDNFGQSISISADHAIIGAPFKDAEALHSGSAYVFELNGSTWTERQRLGASDADPGEYFGESVSISGDRAIVSAAWDDEKARYAGAAYLFELLGGSWVQKQKLVASDAAASAFFGSSVSVSGDRAIIGAYTDDDKGAASGSAYVTDLTLAPGDVAASDGTLESRVRITWEDRSVNEKGYRIYRDGGPIATVGANVQQYEDFDAEPGRTYEYSVAVLTNDISNESEGAADFGWRPANGSITGRISTKGGAGADSVSIAVTPLQSKALLFDGNGGFVSVPDTAGTFGFGSGASFTIEAWVKFSGNGGSGAADGVMIAKATSGSGATRFPFILSNIRSASQAGQLRFSMSDGATTVSVSTSRTDLNDNAWHHVACVHDAAADSLRIYVDGVPAGGAGYAGLGDIVNTEELSFGAGPAGGSAFGGQLDEVRIWSVARSVSQIRTAMATPLAGTEAGLVAYWPLNDVSMSAVTDRTSGAHYGTFEGGVYWTADSPELEIYPMTDLNGNYVLKGIYYGTAAEFEVRPFKDNRQFDPPVKRIALNTQSPVENQANFVDITSFTVSGTIRYAGTACAASDIPVLVDSKPAGSTDSKGKFAVSADIGHHWIRPALAGHAFGPDSLLVNVRRDTTVNDPTGVAFSDSTMRTLAGRLGGGCGRPVGNIVLTIRSENDCMLRTIPYGPGYTDYSVSLPPQSYLVSASVDPQSIPAGLDKTDVVRYFQNLGVRLAEMDSLDVAMDFVYRAPLKIAIRGFEDFVESCPGPLTFENRTFPDNLPVVPQLTVLNLTVEVNEDYGAGGLCPLDSGTVTIYDEIFDRKNEPFNLKVQDGVAVCTTFASTPSLVVGRTDELGNDRSFQKAFTAVASVEGRTPVSATTWALVTGHVAPAGADFVTGTTQVPLYILRDPPGDRSFSFIEQGYRTRTRTKWDHTAYTVKGGPKAELWWGLEAQYFVGLGAGVITKTVVKKTFDTEFIAGNTWSDESTTDITLSTTKRFSTSSSELFIGGRSDVFIGAGYNFIFSEVGVIDVKDCKVERSTSVGFQPDSISTVYSYTAQYIQDVLIPELSSKVDYYRERAKTSGPAEDSVEVFQAKLDYWNGLLAVNDSLKATASQSENRSFSGGADYTYTYTADTTSSYEYTTTFLTDTKMNLAGFGTDWATFGLDFSLTTEFQTEGLNAGSGSGDSTRTSQVGYTLSDDNLGDHMTVDIKKDGRYPTPVFDVLAGLSSCPYEPWPGPDGQARVVPRDKPSLTASPVRRDDAAPGDPAPFTLTLANLNMDEPRLYALRLLTNSNPYGAIVKVGGAPLSNGVEYYIDGGQALQAILTVERGPTRYNYENLTFILYPPCEYDLWRFGAPLHAADTVKVSVTFTAPCSDVTLVQPQSGWMYDQADQDASRAIELLLGGYELEISESEALQSVWGEYRRLGSGNDGPGPWVSIPAESLGTTETVIAWHPPETLEDGVYELRAYTQCERGRGYSETSTGRIERHGPMVLGTPQPSDGELSFGEDISITFNEPIDCRAVFPDTLARYPDRVTLTYLDGPSEGARIPLEAVCNGTMIVIKPTAAGSDLEGRRLKAHVEGIPDKAGNVMGSPVEWTFDYRKSRFAWSELHLVADVPYRNPGVITAELVNGASQPVTFTITGMPSWIESATPSGATIPPSGKQMVSFALKNDLAMDTYTGEVAAAASDTTQGVAVFDLTVTVSCHNPGWAADPGSFEHSMTMVAKVNIGGQMSKDPSDMVAAFVGSQLRGVASPQHVAVSTDSLVFLTIYSNRPSGETVHFKVWDASDCKLYASTLESFAFVANGSEGNATSPRTLTADMAEIGSDVLEIAVNRGWTWISTNKHSPDMSPASVLVGLELGQGDMVKSQTAFSQFIEYSYPDSVPQWVPELELDNVSGYMVNLSAAGTIQHAGTAVPVSTEIPVEQGWNWIGYLPTEAVDVTDALDDLDERGLVTGGDVIKSQTAFAEYVGGVWYGSLATMEPGKGYKLKLSSAVDSFFLYPEPPHGSAAQAVAGAGAEAKGAGGPTGTATPAANAPTWSVNAHDYQYNMTVIAVLRIENAESIDGGDVIGAFVGNECRGVASPVYVEGIRRYEAFLMVHSNEVSGETVTFKAFDADAGVVYEVQETLTLEADGARGTVGQPVVLNASESIETPNVPKAFALYQNVPNPFNPTTKIRFDLPHGVRVSLRVYNAKGELVATVVDREMTEGRKEVVWTATNDHGATVASGIYFYRLVAGEFVQTKKMVLLR
jgi:hypothetical protein